MPHLQRAALNVNPPPTSLQGAPKTNHRGVVQGQSKDFVHSGIFSLTMTSPDSPRHIHFESGFGSGNISGRGYLGKLSVVLHRVVCASSSFGEVKVSFITCMYVHSETERQEKISDYWQPQTCACESDETDAGYPSFAEHQHVSVKRNGEVKRRLCINISSTRLKRRGKMVFFKVPSPCFVTQHRKKNATLLH